MGSVCPGAGRSLQDKEVKEPLISSDANEKKQKEKKKEEITQTTQTSNDQKDERETLIDNDQKQEKTEENDAKDTAEKPQVIKDDNDDTHDSDDDDDDDDDDGEEEKMKPREYLRSRLILRKRTDDRSELRTNDDDGGGYEDADGDDDDNERKRGGDNVRNTRDRDSLKDRYVTALPEIKQSQNDEEQQTVFYNYQFGFFINYWNDKQRNYISAKYSNLKDELLNNELHPITKEAYDGTYERAQDVHKRVEEVLPLKNTIAKNEGNQNVVYGIAVGSKITFNHIFALKLYTDRDKLQYQVKRHCYRVEDGEGVDESKNKHREFANWLKLMREAIWIFGDELGRDKCVYHGLSVKLAFSSYTCVFPGIISTTVDRNVAQSFCGENGVILKLRNPESWKQRYFDVACLSAYPTEQEYLFFEARLEIYSMFVQIENNWTDYKVYAEAWRLYQNLMDGIVLKFNKYSKKSIKLLKRALGWRLSDEKEFYAKFDEEPYAQALFRRLFGEYETVKKERWLNEQAIDGLKTKHGLHLRDNVIKYMDLECFEYKGETMNMQWTIGQNELDALVNNDTQITQEIADGFQYKLFDNAGIVDFYFTMYVDHNQEAAVNVTDDEQDDDDDAAVIVEMAEQSGSGNDNADSSGNGANLDNLSKPIRIDLILYNVVITNRLKSIEHSVNIGYDVFCDELNGKKYFNHLPMANHSDQLRMDGDDGDDDDVNVDNSDKIEETIGAKHLGHVFFSKEMIANQTNGITFNISVRAKPVPNSKYNPETDFTESQLVCKWLKEECGLPQYADKVVQEGYDEWDMIKELDKETMNEDLGIDDESHQTIIVDAIKLLS